MAFDHKDILNTFISKMEKEGRLKLPDQKLSSTKVFVPKLKTAETAGETKEESKKSGAAGEVKKESGASSSKSKQGVIRKLD